MVFVPQQDKQELSLMFLKLGFDGTDIDEFVPQTWRWH